MYCTYPVQVWEDNQAVIAGMDSEQFKSRMKHEDIKYQNVKENVKQNQIQPQYCKSRQNGADVFTKSLTFEIHAQLVEKLGLVMHNVPLKCH